MSERIQNVQPKEYKGVRYRSTLEAETAETLDAMGLPIRYEERRFTVFEGFRCPFQRIKIKPITYKPDFWVGNIILECKGFETPEYLLKKKLIYLGYAIRVTSNRKKKNEQEFSKLYDSVKEAMADLKIKSRAIGSIVRSLTGKTEYVFGYKWKLEKLRI